MANEVGRLWARPLAPGLTQVNHGTILPVQIIRSAAVVDSTQTYTYTQQEQHAKVGTYSEEKTTIRKKGQELNFSEEHATANFPQKMVKSSILPLNFSRIEDFRIPNFAFS